jgi:hypothetical protein
LALDGRHGLVDRFERLLAHLPGSPGALPRQIKRRYQKATA